MISPEVTTEVIPDNENEDEVGEENYQTSEEENISNTCRSKYFPRKIQNFLSMFALSEDFTILGPTLDSQIFVTTASICLR